MTEFDFDELDRAVNSAMAKDAGTSDISREFDDKDITPVTKNKATISARRQNPVVERPKPKDEKNTLTVDDDEKDKKEVKDRTPTKKVPAVARRGTFMDMVHPSARMRSPDRVAVTVRKVAISKSEATQPIDETKESQPSSSANKIVDNISNDQSDEIALTDQLMNSFEDELIERKEAEINETSDSQEPSPRHKPFNSIAESPFLPDAKVEKRPLGDISLRDSAEPSVENNKELDDEIDHLSDLIAKDDKVSSSESLVSEKKVNPERPNFIPSVSDTPKKTVIDDDPDDSVSTFSPDYYQQTLVEEKKGFSIWSFIFIMIVLVLLGIILAAVYYFYETGDLQSLKLLIWKE
ncbi:hypothetical protein CR956_00600 [Candidatus Saccharibacteria bacterium]|nr:MAG: hypothetical protein CR956_00600 [Candidatus Saccharibacteria bacterium]